MNDEIVKSYEQLRKRHNLPLFNEINSEFEISTLENADFLLRGIKDKITEKIEFITNILHPILQPDINSFNDLHECRIFTDEDKKSIFELYGKLMSLHSTSLELSLVNDDKLLVTFINEVYKKWPELKESAIKFIKKIRETWEKEIDIEEELGYLG